MYELTKICPKEILHYPDSLSENGYYFCPIIKLYKFLNPQYQSEFKMIHDALSLSARYRLLLPFCLLSKKCRVLLPLLLKGHKFDIAPILVVKVDNHYEPGGDGHHRICLAKRFNLSSIWVLIYE